MYKLIGLDLDGTLLDSRKKISDTTLHVLREVQARGIRIVLASGRPLAGMRPYLKQLGLCSDHDYVVYFNGSLVENVATGETIHKQVLNATSVKMIARIARELGTNTHAFSQSLGLITPQETSFTRLEASINGISIHELDFESLADDHPMIKAMIVDEPDKLSAIIQQLPETLFKQFTIVRSAAHFLEFLNPLSNKGNGMATIANYFNIPAAEVMCIGDAENDHHMLEFAGLGIAMGNAMENTKAIADHITLSNDEDGVAVAIEKFAFG
jgi:Cof subfamily protein (haloacid dehalogenase superfamily)